MAEFLEIGLLWLVQFFMLLGLVGLVVPVFPGLLIMWLAAFGYGIAEGFGWAGIAIFIVISLLALAGSLADNFLMGVGAMRGGADWKTVLVALGAGILGTLIFPPFGGLIAAPLAILVLEYVRLRDWRAAWQALLGLTTGWGLGVVARVLMGLLINVLWWVWVWAANQPG